MPPSGPRVPAASERDAFFHVVYEHRYFSLAAAAWTEVGSPSSTSPTKDEANRLLPGVGVLILDSLLVHARNLIGFYSGLGNDPTDILLGDFQIPTPRRAGRLQRFYPAIHVHTHHLTAWRDSGYRQQNAATASGRRRQRPDWNAEAPNLVSETYQCLDEVVQKAGAWQQPFAALRDASRKLSSDPASGWPNQLCEKPDVDAYLASLGL